MTLFVVASLVAVLCAAACAKVSRPRYDGWQPEELSRLGPPFNPWPSNGVRKIHGSAMVCGEIPQRLASKLGMKQRARDS